jgi:hypothetical protein
MPLANNLLTTLSVSAFFTFSATLASAFAFCDLGCVAFGDIGFRTVFATFRSGHGDNLFPFIVV